jgi:hypothetical protein
MVKVLTALNNQPTTKMKTTNHKTERVMPVGSSAVLSSVCMKGCAKQAQSPQQKNDTNDVQ